VRTRIFMVLLSIMLVAGITLFSGIARALDPPVPVTSCDLVDKNGNLSGCILTRNLSAVSPDGVKQNWQYELSAECSGTQFAFVVPIGFPTPTIYSFPDSLNWNVQSIPASLSNNWDGFGQFASYSPSKLITFTSQGSISLEFYTDKVLPDTFMPVQVKKGRDYLYCSISGPGLEPAPPLLGSLHSVCENILTGFDSDTQTNIPLDTPFSVLTIVDSASCSISVQRHDGQNCADETPEDITPGAMTLNFGGVDFASLECGSENQQCPVCEIRGHNNPCSYTKYSAGRPYTICYDCSTGARVTCPQ
jgi:hypothetical protein